MAEIPTSPAPAPTNVLAGAPSAPGSTFASPVPPTIGDPNAPTTPAPDLSGLPGPSGTPEQAIYEGNMQGAADQRQQAATEMAKPLPSTPHARLLQMIQGLSAAVAGSGAQWASRGKVNGAEVTNQILAQEAQQRESQQKLAMEQKQQDVQNHLAIGASNEATANMMANLMSLKQRMTQSDLEMKGEKISQIGATQDVRTKALQDYMQTGDLKAYQDTLSQLGNVTAPAGGAPAGGAPTGGAAPAGTTGAAPAVGNLPPVAMGQWQNSLDSASLAYPNDPAIKQAAADFKTAQGVAATNPQAASLAMARSAIVAKNRMTALDAGVKSRTGQEAADPLYKLENDPTALAGANSTAAVAQISGMIANETDSAKLVREKALLRTATAAHKGYEATTAANALADARAKQDAANGNLSGLSSQLANYQTNPDALQRMFYGNPQGYQKVVDGAIALNPKFSVGAASGWAKTAAAPANQLFMGNAGSLTQQGGTLDQLAQAGGNVSKSDFKLLNKTKNWESLQTGDSGISAYTATAIGVADDYAKVLGGSTGTDTSRAMVLEAVDPSLSPAQRAAVIDSMKAAVRSQVKGRMGENPYMQQMYGSMFPEIQQTSGGSQPTAGGSTNQTWAQKHGGN